MITLLGLRLQYFLVILIFFSRLNEINAQCVACTNVYPTSSAVNVTVSTGQTICINAGATMSGTITLNGGVLCNSGTINNLRLNLGRGRINNYGTIKNIEKTIKFNGNIAIYSYLGSQLSFTTVAITMNAADSLFFNVYNGGKVTFSGDLSIASKKLSIVNGLTNPNAPGNLTPTTFSIGGNLSIDNAALNLTNRVTGRLNILGSINLTNAGYKSIVNQGAISISNALNISGTSTATATAFIFISNSNSLTVANSFSCNSNCRLVINNNATTPGINIGKDLVLSVANGITTNNGALTVVNDINYSKGNLSNNSNLTCRNFTIAGANPFQNNGKVSAIGFTVNTNGKLVNNSILDVSQNFSNNGRITLGTQSLLKTLNYSNTSTDTIFGAIAETEDTLKYARILITGTSTNSGAISKKVMIFDESLVNTASNIGYGFDAVINPANIDPAGPRFIKTTIAPGTSGVFNTLFTKYFYKVFTYASSYNMICGNTTSVTLSASLGLPFYNPQVGYNSSYSISPQPTFSWQPGSIAGATAVVNPTVTTTYSSKSSKNGVLYSVPVTINITSNITSQLPSSVTKCSNVTTTISLNATAANGVAPYTYKWSPSTGLSSTTSSQTQTINPTSNINYSVLIKEANGCAKTVTLAVFVSNVTSSVLASYTVGNVGLALLNGSAKNNLTAPYTYNWLPTAGLVASNAATVYANPINTTTYQLNIIDARNCSYNFSTTVYPDLNGINTKIIPYIKHSSRADSYDGSISLSPKTVGSTYNYTWAVEGQTNTLSGITNLAYGNYGVRAYDPVSTKQADINYNILFKSYWSNLQSGNVYADSLVSTSTGTTFGIFVSKNQIAPAIDGEISWVGKTITGTLVVGFVDAVSTSTNQITDISVGIFQNATSLYRYVSGSKAYLKDYKKGDVIRIIRNNNVVNVYLNNDVIYTKVMGEIVSNWKVKLGLSSNQNYSNIGLNFPIPQLLVNARKVNTNCDGANKGFVELYVSGGYPPYTYLWNNNTTASSLRFLNKGTYSVTVTDDANSSVTRSFFIDSCVPINSNTVFVQNLSFTKETSILPYNDSVSITKYDLISSIELNDTSKIKNINIEVIETRIPSGLDSLIQSLLIQKTNIKSSLFNNAQTTFFMEGNRMYFFINNLDYFDRRRIRITVKNQSNQVIQTLSNNLY